MIELAEHHDAVVLLGPPGAGKGTVARRLATELGLVHVDMGELLRRRAERGDAVGGRITAAQAQGVMAPKELVLAALTAELGRRPPGPALVLDGFPRTTAQVAAADDGRVPVRVRTAIWLDVAPDVVAARLRRRREHEARSDDDDRVVATRLGLVAETVKAVRDLYEGRGMLEVVDGCGTVDDVYEQVRARIAPTLSLA